MENEEREIWKGLSGYQGLYEVSSFGRVKMLKYRGLNVVKLAKLSVNNCGYFVVNINKKTMLVHRLVAQSFIENKNNYPEVNHIDGIKKNNNIKNMEWVTKSGNGSHAWRTGLNRSSKIRSSKISKRVSKQIIDLVSGVTYANSYEAARQTGWSQSHLSAMLNGGRTNKTSLSKVNK